MIHQKLLEIQANLKAPKNQYNSFGKYAYRSASDIMEAVKPWLTKLGCTLILDDDLNVVNGAVYFKSTAILTDCENGESVSVTGFAREAVDQKGMTEPQMSGACESYVHKYVLGQLLLIDDTKDPDTEEFQAQNSKNKTSARKTEPKAAAAPKEEKQTVTLKDGREVPREYYEAMNMAWNGQKLGRLYQQNPDLFNNILTAGDPDFRKAAQIIKDYKEKNA